MAEKETNVQVFENWLKLTFRLIVGDHWDSISERVVNVDKTYRWCREIIRNSLFNLTHSVNNFLSTVVISIKDEIWLLRYAEFKATEKIFGLSVWENAFAMAYDLVQDLPKIQDRLCALKFAILAGNFGCEEEKILTLKAKIFDVFFQLKDEDDGERVSKDINETFYIFVDFLSELGIDTEEEKIKMGERIAKRETEWKAPEPWCFGDFGKKEGQMSYPADILVNTQGDFLVLEQDTQGKYNAIQRLQLFDKNGRYQKTLLERGQHGVSSMSYMALDNADNVVVTLKDNQGIGRVQVFNMQGEWVLGMKVPIPNPKFPPMFTSVAVDKEGRTVVVEFHEMAVHIYAANGNFILKFGQGGRTAQKGIFENISCLSISQDNEIYICDPLRSVQVFNAKGQFLRFFKSSGNIPTHVVVGEDEVYALNQTADALEVYSLDGENILRKVGGSGGGLGRLLVPLGIARTPDGLIAVAEKEAHRIQVLKV